MDRDDIQQIGMITYILYGVAVVIPPVALAGVIYAYAKRDEVSGSFVESHLTWLIRTFWLYLAVWAVGIALVLTIIGLLVAWLVFGVAVILYVFRIVKGFVVFNDGQPLPDPETIL